MAKQKSRQVKGSTTKKNTKNERQEISKQFYIIHNDVSTPSLAKYITSQLDLFSVLPGQTSLENGSFTKYHPVSVLTSSGPIEFTVSAKNSNYNDFANSFLYVSANITTAAGTDLAEDVKNTLTR